MTRDGISFSLVVPCYNEAAGLESLLNSFSPVLASYKNAEVIIVDNGSTDGTPAEIERLSGRYPFARFEHMEVNSGYGRGILKGLETAKGDYVGWSHGDLQYDSRSVGAALDIALAAAGAAEKLFIKGRRTGRAAAEVFFTSAMALAARLILGLDLSDINGQPTLFHRSLLERWKNPPPDFTLDLYAYAWALKAGFKIARFPTALRARRHGSSSWNKGLLARLRVSRAVLALSLVLRKELR
ncbi:MAG TPA: glycosyl transferase family 2 [Elusimicrobia bacterium]|nr:glycosyl transferase family 2 [Elusimicrobiota bacterium]